MLGTIERQSAVITAPRQVELVRDRCAALNVEDALVRIAACGLCTMEQRLWMGKETSYPIVAGHEATGTVAALGSGVSHLREGDRVAIAFLDRCMQCTQCRLGRSNLCTGKFRDRRLGVLRRIGGLADYVTVPAWKLFRVPAEAPLEELVLLEPLACVVHSLQRARIALGDNVLVVGAGVMGQLHLRAAAKSGGRAIVCDPMEDRRQLALAHGAALAVHPDALRDCIAKETSGQGVDVVFLATGSAAGLQAAAENVATGGRIIYYASFGADSGVSFSAQDIHRREVRLDGVRGQTLEDWERAVRLLAGKVVDLSGLVSAAYPLSEVGEALDHAARGDSFRVLVKP